MIIDMTIIDMTALHRLEDEVEVTVTGIARITVLLDTTAGVGAEVRVRKRHHTMEGRRVER